MTLEHVLKGVRFGEIIEVTRVVTWYAVHIVVTILLLSTTFVQGWVCNVNIALVPFIFLT